MEIVDRPTRCSICGAGECTTSRLIRGVQADDPAAWQQLIEKASPLVHLWCHRAGMHPSDAADVVQEVFAAAWEGITAFCPDRQGVTFPAWLRGIARHKIADYFRRAARQAETAHDVRHFVHLPATKEAAQAKSGCLCRELQQALQETQSEFEPRTWEAFWRMAVQQQPAAEAGAPLGMNAGAVRRAKHKVLQRLRDKLRSAAP